MIAFNTAKISNVLIKSVHNLSSQLVNVSEEVRCTSACEAESNNDDGNNDGEEDTSSCKQGDDSDVEDVSDRNKKVSKSNHGMPLKKF